MDLESHANTLLRQLLTINHPLMSEAEEKWFKELARVKARVDRGLKVETKVRVAEGRKVVEISGRRGAEEGGGKKVDGRVVEAIEEAYGPLFCGLMGRTRKVERLRMRTGRLSAAVG